ncbi:hypothetical protein MEA186_30167 [Mesorhizobium amorphae CCNWGS0123]|uniref:Uncharacterized protein n=1 Tax=Mesorhizobium amorphae CCNWGS0123 TaxID=1082933 RepID=G6YJ56_9HYPH|nr:hypothetical protein A6B35_32540 [Mesorhizobium amorphae CCNWGS0123]EHH05484.1 hypothetical protein MEA186_30167 [Mesorhizobium amorphae CCNWGS0123]
MYPNMIRGFDVTIVMVEGIRFLRSRAVLRLFIVATRDTSYGRQLLPAPQRRLSRVMPACLIELRKELYGCFSVD